MAEAVKGQVTYIFGSSGETQSLPSANNPNMANVQTGFGG
jgi:hypothetical protein